jgi:2-iminobutanoate/2-iminopropanoate deaminase
VPKQVPGTPSGPAPIGPYSIATEANGLVFISGQVAINPATQVALHGTITEETRRVLDNLVAILGDLGLGTGDVVKTTVFLSDMADFPDFNAVYGEYFGDDPPARSTFEVAGLPAGFKVEIETIAAR